MPKKEPTARELLARLAREESLARQRARDRARDRAMYRLKQMYPEDYLALYREELAKQLDDKE